MEDKTLQMTLLFDFFGNLLTDKQRQFFDLYYNEDLSLSEIAENEGISRQGVRDMIVRAENILRETEEKTGIIKRFKEIQADIAAAEIYAREIEKFSDKSEISALSKKIIEKLQNVKG